ncbi:PREDICTED: ankyrin repeat domain-containing protein 13D isoform X2 [Nicrophorus vespilloides]|uniref:Ankyrin repeat domain-containing protein 13D isoform X2 n=1 Tax=Nicrophorus vespilloides TaxID=110193 RepID=A0ABM1N0Q1_NICVS|nr:PREDICTED: ankyrin repeat domain-containing protein 13D isoform X2 [Nicrophorus vespilloides]
MVTAEFIKSEYPLHWFVWYNDFTKLEEELHINAFELESRDNRGRTPLMLAVTLGHLEVVRVLLNHHANVNCENPDGWTVVQEAVSTGDPELLHMVLQRRDFQRYSNRMAGIPELLQKLKEAPDFYVEMKWEFTSWVPLISRMCPSDTYKVYKQGSNVRIDTTLLGFDHTSWQRGNRSYIFQGHVIQICEAIRGNRSYIYSLEKTEGNDGGATMMEVDHEAKQVFCEQMRAPDEAQGLLSPSEEALSQRLTTPIVTTYVDTDKISFERNKAGMWGWRSDKQEAINGYECKVFGASNVELVTKTRTEHLTETDKAIAKSKTTKTPLQNFLGIAEVEEKQAAAARNEEYSNAGNPCNITPEEYFDENVNLNGRDIGRPKEVYTKIQKFKATLWLSENYPLSLPEQILPIVDLMAISSSHFAKLRNFIQMQLPSGFPVKIEIPLFHVINARITFGNIFGMDMDIPYVTRIEEEDRLTCALDDVIFQSPPGYTQLVGADGRRQYSIEEEDDLLQFAIQQSLIDAGTEKEEVDIWEALKAKKPSRPTTPNFIGEEERQLQKAIQASLALYQNPGQVLVDSSPDTDSELNMALLLSEQQREQEEEQRLEEQRMLEEVLQLSLTDK